MFSAAAPTTPAASHALDLSSRQQSCSQGSLRRVPAHLLRLRVAGDVLALGCPPAACCFSLPSGTCCVLGTPVMFAQRPPGTLPWAVHLFTALGETLGMKQPRAPARV